MSSIPSAVPINLDTIRGVREAQDCPGFQEESREVSPYIQRQHDCLLVSKSLASISPHFRILDILVLFFSSFEFFLCHGASLP